MHYDTWPQTTRRRWPHLNTERCGTFPLRQGFATHGFRAGNTVDPVTHQNNSKIPESSGAVKWHERVFTAYASNQCIVEY